MTKPDQPNLVLAPDAVVAALDEADRQLEPLRPIGACHDCGKWLPGERRLCGRCTNHRARAG